MGIDKGQLQAFAGKGEAPDEGYEEEHAEPDAEAGEELGAAEAYAPLIDLLEEFSEEVQECIDELDGEMLQDPDLDIEPADEQILQEGVTGLDRRLQKQLAADLPGMPPEAIDAIGAHVEDEGHTAEGALLAGWLWRVQQTLFPEEGAGEGEEEGAEEFEDE